MLIPRKLDSVRRGVLALQRDFGLTGEQLVEVLALTDAESAALASDTELPATFVHRLQAARSCLSINGAGAWRTRVEQSAGVELLLSRDLTVIAASPGACEAPDRNAPERLIRIAPDAIVGRNYDDLLPVRGVSMTGEAEPGFSGLVTRGLFAGRVHGHQVSATVVFGPFAIKGVWETWAVATPEAGPLAHAILHRELIAAPAPAGVTVHWTKWF
jgi:hypothetical protein